VPGTIDAALALEPDIVGSTLPFSFSQAPAVAIAEGLKKSRPDLPIIFGGIQATFSADALLRNPAIDAIVLGEGEQTFAELIELFVDGGFEAVKLSPPQGLRLMCPSGELVGERRPFIDDLDTLPFPSLDLLLGFPSEYSARILMSRGCRFRCPYCASSAYWGHVFRAHSPRRVVDEMISLREKYGITRVSFADDTFNQDRERAREIARMLIESEPGFQWGASCRPEILSDDDLRLFVSAGMTGLFLGLESGSAKVLKSIRRNHDLAGTRNLVELAESLGVAVHASFMIGLPDETAEDIEQTIAYIRHLPASSIGVHIFHPLPGSEFGDNSEKYGIVMEVSGEEKGRLGAIDTYAPVRTRYLSSLQIVEYYDKARAVAANKSQRKD
jgi:radical SAM superfamily enzyme YgiQ (UPF0313 family)